MVVSNTILFLEDVLVSFDGFKALNNLNFSMDKGELRCLIGPNGAGKSTLLDVVTGKVKPNKGRVIFGKNIDLTRLKEEEIANTGVGRKFQTPTVFETLTVRENLELSVKQNKRVMTMIFKSLKMDSLQRVDEILEIIGLQEKQNNRSGLLAHGEKQWLEIGMVMVQNPELLLIDEPVAGMTDTETEKTADLLRTISKDRSVLVIEHDMKFVRELESRVTVLHEGSVICEGSIDHIHNDPRVIELYLGREKNIA